MKNVADQLFVISLYHIDFTDFSFEHHPVTVGDDLIGPFLKKNQKNPKKLTYASSIISNFRFPSFPFFIKSKKVLFLHIYRFLENKSLKNINQGSDHKIAEFAPLKVYSGINISVVAKLLLYWCCWTLLQLSIWWTIQSLTLSNMLVSWALQSSGLAPTYQIGPFQWWLMICPDLLPLFLVECHRAIFLPYCIFFIHTAYKVSYN